MKKFYKVDLHKDTKQANDTIGSVTFKTPIIVQSNLYGVKEVVTDLQVRIKSKEDGSLCEKPHVYIEDLIRGNSVDLADVLEYVYSPPESIQVQKDKYEERLSNKASEARNREKPTVLAKRFVKTFIKGS